MQAADFNFVGQAYEASDPYQDCQRLINWYLEYSQDEGSKTPSALLGTPGLDRVLRFDVVSGDIAIPYTGGFRGGWVLPGGLKALCVVGSGVFLVRTSVPATQTSIAQFTVGFIGSIGTNSGLVCMRDNGAAGYVIIVDGSPSGYLFNITTNALTVIGDAGFYGADRVAFINGWWILNKPGTQIFYTNGPTPYSITFPASFFALKDNFSDNLITLAENTREVWLIGEATSEVWAPAGSANFGFARIPGVSPQMGCAAKHSIARLGQSLVWLARSERGQNVVVQTVQYGYKPISTKAIEYAISTYPLVSDAEAFTYEEEGHSFYVLNFPTADKTWVYDETTEKWHQRASFNTSTGAYHVWKASGFMNLQNLRIVGDRTKQQAYRMSRTVYDEYDSPIVANRRCPHIWSREDRKRIFGAMLQIEFRPGVGLLSGQGSLPRAMLSISYDGGTTFSAQYFLNIGATGKYKNRAIKRKLSTARDMVFDVSFSEPVNRDIVGATLSGGGEYGAQSG